LVKRAIYSANVRPRAKEFYLLFHFRKIVPIHRPTPEFAAPRRRCACVFPAPSPLALRPSPNAAERDASYLLLQEPDAELPGDVWHRRLRTPIDPTMQVPVADPHRMQQDPHSPNDLSGLHEPWASRASEGVQLVIGLPARDDECERCLTRLKEEVELANRVLEESDKRTRYVLGTGDAEIHAHKVATVVVKHR
jgi:hypothetical protein